MMELSLRGGKHLKDVVYDLLFCTYVVDDYVSFLKNKIPELLFFFLVIKEA